MVRMQAVPLPWVVAEHDLRSNLANNASNLTAHSERAVQFAIDVTEETHLASVVR